MLALEVKEMAEASEVLKKLGVGKITRHLLLCTGPKCCDESVGQKAWEAVKAEIASSGLGQGEDICFRTKVGCLRLCQQGPVALVYPEGVWYGEITADRVLKTDCLDIHEERAKAFLARTLGAGCCHEFYFATYARGDNPCFFGWLVTV